MRSLYFDRIQPESPCDECPRHAQEHADDCAECAAERSDEEPEER